MQSSSTKEREAEARTGNLIVVSGDSHVGPRLVEDLRRYCPAAYVDEFDRFVGAQQVVMAPNVDNALFRGASTETNAAAIQKIFHNQQTAGHYDVVTRLREMDWDGVAAEVVYHGSQNDQSLPFVGLRDHATTYTALDVELVAVGYRIYNEWLADFVSVDPGRHIGLIYAPLWDVDLAVKEVEWGAAHGLKGVNLPAPRAGIAEYDDPSWEPFWSTCEDLRMTLSTHAGVPPFPISGPQAVAITQIETMGWPARRGMHRMILGGVFARHPQLHLVLTEQTRGWWSYAMRELDYAYGEATPELRAQVPEKPSYYMRKNVFLGASFLPPAGVEEAIAEGYASNVVWGRDYPHGEGTYRYPDHDHDASMTRACIRWAFAGCPLEDAQAMLGENGIRAYHLDRDFLAGVAARIGAPTPEEVATPLETLPAGWVGDIFGQ